MKDLLGNKHSLALFSNENNAHKQVPAMPPRLSMRLHPLSWKYACEKNIALWYFGKQNKFWIFEVVNKDYCTTHSIYVV